MEKETFIISLGGSLIVPNEIDKDFLKSFKELIIKKINEGNRFVIITGGGKICRKYQDSAKDLASPSDADLDWIGIASLKLNAELIRVIFEDYAHHIVVKNFEDEFDFDKAVIVGSAYKPGQSTDWGSVVAGKKLGAKKIINLSNIDYAYDKDPNKFPDAKKIEQISWSEYRSLIPEEWNPGLSTPFDPIASKMAEVEGMTVCILNGKNISNLEKCLNGEEFLGTTIK